MKTLTSKARILIVEDESLIAEELADRLGRLGYQVVADAATGRAAVAAARRTIPDLILMDIRLKGRMDGISAAEQIGVELDVPIVYLTAHSDAATLDRARASHPFGYVLKPFQEKDLVIAIEMALERHAVERRLRESEARYVTTLRSIGEGVIATDTDRCVTFMNPTAERLTGWSFDEAGGTPVDEVARFTEGGRDFVHPIDEALRLRQVVHISEPMTLAGREGTMIPVEDSASPILDASGELMGAVMAFRDCRERQAARDALREAEAHLQEALRLEALGRLAGGVAHDFNNILTIVIGCGELLADRVADDERAAMLVREIVDAGQRASSLTDQLLAYSRQRLVAPRTVDLNELLRGIEDLLARLVGEDIEIRYDLAPDPLHVSVEPNQLEQAIVNLAANARDAIHGKGGRILFRTRPGSALGDAGPTDVAARRSAVLDVEDSGQGMDEETRSRVFEPFFTTKALGRGTGLGLATVFGTVRQFGGGIDVESAVGQGTTFTIRLPLDEAPKAQEPDEGGERQDVTGTETVLLVEDDPGVGRMAASSLQSFGYTVHCVPDGPSALEAFDSAARIDLLVTDVVLPGWNGRKVAGLLQARDPELRVLYVSGHTDDEVLRRGLVEERVDLLRKPFTPVELALRVREILDR